MWNNLVDKSKCLLGFHTGSWQYRDPHDCAQFQVCDRCKVETRRLEHQ